MKDYTPRKSLRHATGLALLSFAMVGLCTAPALAEGSKADVKPRASGMQVQTQTSGAKVQVLNLPKGRSAVIDLPVDAADVFVSNPAVADAVLRTPRRIFVLGVANGQSDAIFFDGMGRQIMNLSIRVDAPTDELTDTIHRLFPGAKVEVQSLNGHVILSGMAQNDGEADQITRLAASFADKPENVLNLMSIAGKDQVTLKVRIVEVNRNAMKQLGFSNAITANNGTRTYSFGNSTSYGINGAFQGGKGLCYGQAGTQTSDITNASTATAPIPNGSVTDTVTTTAKKLFGTDATNCLQAFERVGLVRTLAEPNLSAVSGESAKFLAGGEYPVPSGLDNQGRVSITFKPFGVGLGFTPVVLSSGLIALKISTEVSELSNTGAYTITGGVTVPALSVRRAETSVEMQSGSSMMIAGLLQSKYKQAIDSLPGLTSMPVIGALMRSRDFLNDETEMVVIVTPYIVSATDPDKFQTPADNLTIADDATAVFMGRLNKVVGAHADEGAQPKTAPAPYQAPVGYVIE